MSTELFLTVKDHAAWHALAIVAWGADEDGNPAIPRRVVSVDEPFPLIAADVVLDDDGNVVTPAELRDHLGVNLAAPDEYVWPDEIMDLAIDVETPDRGWAR